jgi:hypothetical protein
MTSDGTESAIKYLLPIVNKIREAFVVMKESHIALPGKFNSKITGEK